MFFSMEGGSDIKGMDIKERAKRVFEILKAEYPDAGVLLNYTNPFELLIATILAAQCTDERVNRVTPELFKKYPDANTMAKAVREELEEIIRPTGFYKNKAKSLINVSRAIAEKYGGNLPKRIDELATLPGVGRKTASVVAGVCFDEPAIIVDTHVRRVASRLGFTSNSNPDKIELDLKALIDKEKWTEFSYALNFHGRYVCKARKPLCDKCSVVELCESAYPSPK